MTLSKLSLRNAKRQAQDYLVYFITIILSAALIYAFNGLVDSQEIQRLSQMMESLSIIIVLATIVVVFVIGWLVNYTMRFMLTKRSRELGTYILLGLENKQVIRLFFMENLIIGSLALVIGMVLGNLIFQYLRAILLRMFDAAYSFSFSFSLKVIGLTLIYFVLIYLFALIKGGNRIRRMKIYDLLYFDRQNEDEAVKKSKNRRRMFTASIICGVIGTLMLIMRQLLFGILGAVFIILFLYGFFISFSSGVPAFFNKRQAKKYAKTNLLVYRSLSSKLTTMGVTMATISLLFTATLISEGTGLLFANQFKRNEALFTSYDLFIASSDTESGFDFYKEYIKDHIPVREEYEYYVYLGDDDNVMGYIQSKEADYTGYYERDTLLGMSDYAALRRMLGWPEVYLEPVCYIVHCMDYLEEAMAEYKEPLMLGGRKLTPYGVYSENFTQFLWDGNGRGYILVVADEVAKAYEPVNKIYAAMTKEPVRGEVFGGLQELQYAKSVESSSYDSVLSPAAVREDNASLSAMIVFPLFYLALVLTMAAATILTIQLLSDVNRYKKQYGLLYDLGMDRSDMRQALRHQFALFYAMPVLPPLFICIVFMLALGDAFDPGIIVNQIHLWGIIGAALAIFFVIYLIYIAASYTSFRRNIIPE